MGRLLRSIPWWRLASFGAAEAPLDPFHHRVVVELTRCRKDHVARPVVVAVKVGDPLPAHGFDGGLAAQHVPAQRMVREHGLTEQVVDEVARLVAPHEDLLQDDLALGLHLVRPERRVPQDVRQQVERQLDALAEQPDVERRVLLGRVGVHVPTYRVHLVGDLLGRAAGRALEEQVLEEMGGTRQPNVLVPRAGAHPEPATHRAHVRHALGHHDHPAVELGGLDHPSA
jgi:hypothetical protein